MTVLFFLSSLARAQDPAPATEPAPPTEPAPATSADMAAVMALLQQLAAQQAAAAAAAAAPAPVAPPEPAPAGPDVLPPADPAVPAPLVDVATEDDGSFGKTLNLLEKKVSWSAYGDVILAGDEAGLTFQATHFNPILGARMSQDLYSEMEIEFEDNGLVVKLEYGYIDWTPSPAISLRIGQFLTPIGEFNEGLHPSFRWSQVSRPDVFTDVMPAVWSDVGVQVFGEASSAAVDFDWSVYANNGLGGAWDPEAGNTVRPLRERPDADGNGRIADNNFDKGVGGRARLKFRPAGARAMVSMSGYTGAVEDDDTGRLVILDLAGDLDARSVGVRFEGAQTLYDGEAFERGLYVQLWGKIKKITPAARFDVTHRAVGDTYTKTGVALSALYSVRPHWNLRGEFSGSLTGELAPKGTLMAAFYF